MSRISYDAVLMRFLPCLHSLKTLEQG
jgi:hypothetical protein